MLIRHSPDKSALSRLTTRLTLALVCGALALAACSSDDGSGGTATETDGGQTAADATTQDGTGSDTGTGNTDTTADGASTDTSNEDTAPQTKVWAVGVTTIQVKGAGGRTLPTDIWYPIESGTTGTAAKYALGLIPSPYGAIRDATAAKGPFPLVAFSHGNQGVRDQSPFLTEHLARNGYVVVSPDHIGNTFTTYDVNLTGAITIWRPGDIKAAIDRIANPEAGDPAWLKGLADTTKVGMTGHSFGGYTTLATAGVAVTLPQGVTIDCAKRPKDDATCKELANLGPPPWQLGDARIAVAVPLAHALYAAGGLSHASAKKLAVPMIIMAATGDTLTKRSAEAVPLYNDLTAAKALITIHGGGHMTFADVCPLKKAGVVPAGLAGELDALCSEAAKPTQQQAHAFVADMAVAAFDVYLKGDDSQRAKLAPMAQGQGNFSIQSEGIVKP